MIIKYNSTYQNLTSKTFKVFALLMLLLLYECVDPYEGSIGTYEDVLVVNCIVTNQNKHHEVSLTHSYRFEDDGPKAERNAHISITTDDGEEFLFEETQPGKYRSVQPFAAQMNKDYRLMITTSNGKSYASKNMQLPVSSTKIDMVYAKRMVNGDGNDGMGIFVESFDPTGQSKYYRHAYEETYKIVAPNWSPYDVYLIGEGEQQDYFSVILREREERTCYGTNSVNPIILKSTVGLNEDRLKDYNIRFIDRNNYILSYRYSILVKQYVQSPEAFSYYETLKGLSQTSDNIFSEDQPGFLAGNVFSLDDPNEHVVGFFEVATEDEKRIFFNYEDFFPGEELPPYVVGCITLAPYDKGRIGERPLGKILKEGNVRFYGFNTNPAPFEGPYILTSPECGDCTTLGSNLVPDFWIE